MVRIVSSGNFRRVERIARGGVHEVLMGRLKTMSNEGKADVGITLSYLASPTKCRGVPRSFCPLGLDIQITPWHFVTDAN